MSLKSLLGFKEDLTKRRDFWGMSRSGQLLQEHKATELNEELIVDRHDMSFDDDRQVRHGVLYREGTPCTPAGYIQLYTGGSMRLVDDARYWLVKGPAIAAAAAKTVSTVKAAGASTFQKMGLVVLGAGVVVFLACILIVGINMKSNEGGNNAPIPIVTPLQADPAEPQP